MPLFHRPANSFALIALITALLAFSGCATKEERESRALYNADRALQKGQTDEAISILSKAVLKHPESASLQEALASARLETNAPSAAVESYLKAIELDPNRQHLWATVADLRLRLGDKEAAAGALANYLEGFPEDFLAWKNYAILQEELGDLDMAIKATSEWNRIRPSAAPALRLGRLFKESGLIPQAHSWISQAAAYVDDPDAKIAMVELIELEIGLQQYLPASTWLEKYDSRYGSQSDDPKIQAARETIAKWRQAQIDIAEAAAKLEEKRKELERQALEAQQREEQMRREREALVEEQARIAAPRQSVEASEPEPPLLAEPSEKAPLDLIGLSDAEPEPEPVQHYLDDARAAVAAADYLTAIDLYWNALGPASDDPNIWFELSNVYRETRDWLDAEACILQAKRRAPRSAPIAAAYLYIISYTQPAPKVAQEAEALITLFPDDAPIALALARTLKKANAPQERVARAYDSFLQYAQPGDEGYDEAQRYIGSVN